MTFKHKLARCPAHLILVAAMLPVLSCSGGDLKSGLGPPDLGPGSRPPVAEANGPYSAVVGTAVRFSSQGSSDPDTTWSAAWDFGDGMTGVGTNPSHVYSSAGTYTAVLVVTAADSATAVDNAQVTITASQPPPPPPTAGHPNEPSGYVRFAEYDFTTALLHGVGDSNGTEIDGCAWKWDPGGNFSIVTDATAPQSPPNVLQVKYPLGQPTGTGPGFYQLWDTCAQTNNTEYSKFYTSIHIKLVGTDWEGHPNLTKWLGYYGHGKNGEGRLPTEITGILKGTGTQFSSQFTFAFNQQSVQDRQLSQNVNTGLRIVVGSWHHIEILMEVNNPVDTPNGILRMWLDGQLALDHSDVIWRTSAFSSGFYGRIYHPIWGGGSADPKTRDDFIYIDHEYMSGVP